MRTLSITLSDNLYCNLKHAIPSRQISKFVGAAVEEKLDRMREGLYQAYVAANQDRQREQEIEIWDELVPEDWRFKRVIAR